MTEHSPADLPARRAAARLGRIGVWSNTLTTAGADQARAAAQQIESYGYGSIWIGENPRLSREAFTGSALLLAATEHIVIATGIANIWLRESTTSAAAQNTLAEAYPERFILGLGASHGAALSLIGKTYDKPLTALSRYLDAMRDAPHFGPKPAQAAPIVIAALQQRMQTLAKQRCDGMHSFFVPARHTAAARHLLGTDPLLVPEQAVIVEPDPDVARRRARKHIESRLMMPNYVAHLRALGYHDEDMADGGSDALVDDLVAWGNPFDVARQVQGHLDAGADHVAIHPLEHRGDPLGLNQLEQLVKPLLQDFPDEPSRVDTCPT